MKDELALVADQGWSLVDQELEVGVRSVAVALHDADKRVVAAVNTSAHAARISLATLKGTFLPSLSACARDIDLDLAGSRY